MVGDNLECPNCGYPYSEEYLESMIWKSFKCERCYVKVKVRMIKGFIKPSIRHDRMIYFGKRKEELENHKYMEKQLPKFIRASAKKYNTELKEVFFKEGKWLWVREARKNFFFWCYSIGIPFQVIVSFFSRNDGKADIRTIKSYIIEKENEE